MPTAKQSWLKKYETYYAQTEYNKKHYGKRIKQLTSNVRRRRVFRVLITLRTQRRHIDIFGKVKSF